MNSFKTLIVIRLHDITDADVIPHNVYYKTKIKKLFFFFILFVVVVGVFFRTKRMFITQEYCVWKEKYTQESSKNLYACAR